MCIALSDCQKHSRGRKPRGIEKTTSLLSNTMTPKTRLRLFVVGLMASCSLMRISGFSSPRLPHLHPSRDNIEKHSQVSIPITSLRETNKDGGVEKPRELTPDTVAEMIEVSFVNACLQLAQGYVDVLKLFIVSVKAGYELNLAPADIIQRVDDFPHQSAGRDLMQEEIKLRNTWIGVIYLVLHSLQHEKKVAVEKDESATAAIDKNVRSTFSLDLLSEMKKAQDSGDAFQLDTLLEGHPFPKMDDPTERAIVSQSLRVIWMTYTVLEEEARCLNEKSGLKAQPPIPGAFE